MDKQKIIDQLFEKVNQELGELKEAYNSTKELIQTGDLKSDGKYDTRATEANYLADGQRQRISELEQELELLEEINITAEQNLVSIGSLVKLEFNNTQKYYFVAPTAGGTMLNIDGEVVLVISVFSPIGDGALGIESGDSFEVEINNDLREYKVLQIS